MTRPLQAKKDSIRIGTNAIFSVRLTEEATELNAGLTWALAGIAAFETPRLPGRYLSIRRRGHVSALALSDSPTATATRGRFFPSRSVKVHKSNLPSSGRNGLRSEAFSA